MTPARLLVKCELCRVCRLLFSLIPSKPFYSMGNVGKIDDFKHFLVESRHTQEGCLRHWLCWISASDRACQLSLKLYQDIATANLSCECFNLLPVLHEKIMNDALRSFVFILNVEFRKDYSFLNLSWKFFNFVFVFVMTALGRLMLSSALH